MQVLLDRLTLTQRITGYEDILKILGFRTRPTTLEEWKHSITEQFAAIQPETLNNALYNWKER